MPGSLIPIVDVSQINIYKLNGIMILPWNLSEEILKELKPLLNKPVIFFKAPSLMSFSFLKCN